MCKGTCKPRVVGVLHFSDWNSGLGLCLQQGGEGKLVCSRLPPSPPRMDFRSHGGLSEHGGREQRQEDHPLTAPVPHVLWEALTGALPDTPVTGLQSPTCLLALEPVSSLLPCPLICLGLLTSGRDPQGLAGLLVPLAAHSSRCLTWKGLPRPPFASTRSLVLGVFFLFFLFCLFHGTMK